jgi:U2 small nuclear ribonucleoprotein B''
VCSLSQASSLPACSLLSAERPEKRPRSEAEEEAPAAAREVPIDAGAANKILFVEGLPEATSANMLSLLFKQFPGFAEVRMVDARPGIAFVEYDSELNSSVALSGLAGFKVTPENALRISFAKRD